MEKIQSIAVYCGARPGNNLAYRLVAEELGRELALRKIRLVYGGGGTGVMGTLSDSVLDNGGQVTGVIPRFLDSPAPRFILFLKIINFLNFFFNLLIYSYSFSLLSSKINTRF